MQQTKPSLKENVENIAGAIGAFFSEPKDVVEAIKQDHEGLRNYLDILKDTEKKMTDRKRAYQAFSDLLKSHTKSEERAVYKTADEMPGGHDMHIKIAEGYVEHHLADDLMKRLDSTTDATEWSAHANVLSEIVQHHLDEEERDLLPLIRKTASVNENMDMLSEFLSIRGQTQEHVNEKNAGVLKNL